MIEFNQRDKTEMVDKIQRYFENKLDQELGQFDAEFLLDFFNEEIGGYFYNQGLQDAKIVFDQHLEVVSDNIYGLEKATL